MGWDQTLGGLESGTFTPDQAEAALAHAIKNPDLAMHHTTGVTGWFFGTHENMDSGKFRGGWGLYYRTEGSALGKVQIDGQEQAPDNPGIRKIAVSTYGAVIPISTGRRRLAGNIIDATDAVPRLVGSYDYYKTYNVPVYDQQSPCAAKYGEDGNKCSSDQCQDKLGPCLAEGSFGCLGEDYAIYGTTEHLYLNVWKCTVTETSGSVGSGICNTVGFSRTVFADDALGAGQAMLNFCGCGVG